MDKDYISNRLRSFADQSLYRLGISDESELLVGESINNSMPSLEAESENLPNFENPPVQGPVILPGFDRSEFIRPSQGRLSSKFGPRRAPKAGASTFHRGIDLAAPIGTPVYASRDGVVSSVRVARGYGNLVVINHGNGYETRYAHLNRSFVRVGQNVRKGELIAHIGNTGVSTGPHLHFEIRLNGVAYDPLKYIRL